MYASWFEYNITKPYPFRWFTPVTIVGGILFTVLFSTLNLGANGYYLSPKYTNDPNTTVEEGSSAWFMKAPFTWVDHLSPDCEPLVIPVGYQFFTTNLGLRYEVTKISRYDAATDTTVQLPSLSYFNNTLEDCRMRNVKIELRKADGSPPPSYWWSWDNSYCTATSTCNVVTPDGPVDIALDTQFSTTYTDFSYLIQDNYTTHASLWWGSRLLNLYWYGIMVTAAHVRTQDDPPTDEFYVKGMFDYISQGDDVKQYDYFDLVYYFLQAGGTLYNGLPTGGWDNVYNNPSNTYSQPMTEGLQFAKMFRSLLAVDLGNDKRSNLLLDDELLQYAIYAPDDTNRHWIGDQRGPLNFTGDEVDDWSNYNGINWPGTGIDFNNRTWVNESYPLFKDVVGPLGTKPATIYAQYACSVPKKKSTGNLLLAMLLADLVFLQALWKIYTLSAEGLATRVDPNARVCRGCVGERYQSVGMKPYHHRVTSESESIAPLVQQVA